MNRDTKAARLEGYINRPLTRNNLILKTLGDGEMTAREIAYKLHYPDLNMVKPRLSEMLKQGILKTCGRRKDLATGINVTVYRRNEE